MTTKTLAEQMVDALREKIARSNDLEDWMRQIRLGDELETEESITTKRLFWTTERECRKPFPHGMAAEFYQYMRERKGAIDAEARDLREKLAALGSDPC